MNKDNDFFRRIEQQHKEENELEENAVSKDAEEQNYEYYTKNTSLYPEYKQEKKEKRRIDLLPIIITALISAIIGGLITAYIGPIYLYGKYIDVPYIGGQEQKIEIIPKSEELTVASAVAKKSMPSVVGITTVSIEESFFFGPTKSAGVGTGVIVDSRGYILTNSHVVNNGQADEVNVLLHNGDTIVAEILWYETSLDLAVLKVDAQNLPVADLGNSDNLEVGQTTIAIGNPLGLSFERTVTAGILSGLNRSIQITQYESIEGLLQTDASINPGNSGGPLLNAKGEVIGINTAKIQTGEGLGFAIPINIAKPIVDEFIEKGQFKKVYLGVSGVDMSTVKESYQEEFGVESGVLVYKVVPNSNASRAGLRDGDIVVSLGEVKMESMRQMVRELYKYRPGDETNLGIIRNGKKMNLNVKFEDTLR